MTAALETATEASDAAAAPVYAAEDLYLALSDKEREIDAVKAAYSSLTALVISMQLAMQNPVAPNATILTIAFNLFILPLVAAGYLAQLVKDLHQYLKARDDPAH